MTAALTLGNDEAEFRRLADFAAAFAERHRLPGPEWARLLIILEELFTNIVKHGYDGEPVPGRIEITLSLNTGHLVIEVSDDGGKFDPLAHAAPDLDLPAEQRPIGGLGILLWRSLVDEARYRHDGARNHLVLTRRLAAPNPPADAG